MNNQQQRSPWLYIGCGCLAFIGLVVIVIAALGYFGVRQVTQSLTDPVVREERALAMLGADSLPAGYNAQFFLRVPLFMEMVVLSDGEAAVAEGLEDIEDHKNLFFFLKVRADPAEKAKFERYLEGEEGDSQIVDQIDVDFRRGEVASRGRFESGDQTVSYLAQSGEIRDDGERVNGFFTLAGIDCPGDERLRVAAWVQRTETAVEDATAESTGMAAEATDAVEVETPETGTEIDIAGTIADQAVLQAFLDHFELCAAN